MARLPDPIVDSMEIDWPEEYKVREDTLHEIIGQLIGQIERDKIKEGEDKEK